MARKIKHKPKVKEQSTSVWESDHGDISSANMEEGNDMPALDAERFEDPSGSGKRTKKNIVASEGNQCLQEVIQYSNTAAPKRSKRKKDLNVAASSETSGNVHHQEETEMQENSEKKNQCKGKEPSTLLCDDDHGDINMKAYSDTSKTTKDVDNVDNSEGSTSRKNKKEKRCALGEAVSMVPDEEACQEGEHYDKADVTRNQWKREKSRKAADSVFRGEVSNCVSEKHKNFNGEVVCVQQSSSKPGTEGVPNPQSFSKKTHQKQAEGKGKPAKGSITVRFAKSKRRVRAKTSNTIATRSSSTALRRKTEKDDSTDSDDSTELVLPEAVRKDVDDPVADLAEESLFCDDGYDSPVDEEFEDFLLNTKSFPSIHRSVAILSADFRERYEKETGVTLANGRFTFHEDEILKKNYKNIAKHFKIRYPYLMVGHRGQHSWKLHKQMKAFVEKHKLLSVLGKGLETRSLYAIYNRARILFDPFKKDKKVVKLTPKEKKKLFALYGTLGPQWVEISRQMKKPAQALLSCVRTQYETTNLNTGTWTKEEVRRLGEAVKLQCGSQDPQSAEISWDEVAKHVGTRSDRQCRNRWCINDRMTSWHNIKKDRWNSNNSVHLIHLVYHINVTSRDQINWGALVKDKLPWALSPMYLKRVWRDIMSKIPKTIPSDFRVQVKYLYETLVPALLCSKYGGKTIERAIWLSENTYLHNGFQEGETDGSTTED